MLTVWCVYVGDKYPVSYVYNLAKMVNRNLTLEYEFICLSDREIPGIRTIETPINDKSWWSKIGLFKVANTPSIYLDLDLIILDNIDYLFEYTKYEFSACSEFRFPGIQSSVMAWSGHWSLPYDQFNLHHDKRRFHGDQDYLYAIRRNDFVKIPHIYSYRYHCQNKQIPTDAKIILFHGKLNYTNVDEDWIKSALQES